MNKAKLETEITKIVSEIFLNDIDKGNDCVEFLTLRTKLTDLIWRWAKCTFSTSKLENAGVEITQCITRSILSYHGDADKFISYLAVALKQEIKRANIKLSIEEKRIIHLPEKKERRLRGLITNAERYGKNIDDSKTQQWLSQVCGYSIEEIRQFVEYKMLLDVKSEYMRSEDGKEVSMFDNVKTCIEYNGEEPFRFVHSENVREDIYSLLKNIGDCFSQEKANTQDQKCSKKYGKL